MKKLSLLVLSLVAIMGVQSAKAWGGFGHSAITYVAEQHLTPEAKAKCRYYLKHTIVYYASWMDYWRSVPEYRSVNSQHTISAMPDGRTLDWSGKPKGKAMGYLKNAIEELGNGNYKNLPDSVVRQNIIYLIHSVADMHCPVHVQFPKTTFPHYRYTVKRKGKSVNMHGFWDASPAYKRRGWTYEMYADEVDKISPKQAKKIIKKGDYDYWGRDILKNTHRIYNITTADKEITKLTSEESAAVSALADEMAMKAAYRLAYVLNRIFK